jgi:uncharacterized membrane protein YciS (DUF1049 family)
MSEPTSEPTMVQAPSQRLPRNGLGVTALVTGVVGVILAILVVLSPLAAILGAVAVGTGIAGIARANRGLASNRGQAVAGLVAGLLALAISIAIMVSAGVYLSRHSTDLRDFGRCMDRATTDSDRSTCIQNLSDRLGNRY